MSYNATYDQDDVDDIAIDGVARYAVAIVGFATLIALVWVYGYFKKKLK